MAVAEKFPGVAHQRPWHLQDQVHRPVLGRFHVTEMLADAKEHIVAEETAALSQPLQRSRWLSIDIAANLANFLEDALQAGARDLVIALDDGCRSIQRRQPYAIGRDRIVGSAIRHRLPRAGRKWRDGLLLGWIDGEKERVRRRQCSQLVGMSSGQRAIAGETTHQLIPGFKRCGGQL